ncbi:cupin domain-containing protein [Dysgonomonas macrotermitis]|uniref:Mannose-6-phosphate isomerase, cupin superfamily n=1 Tax=Dysgonomonas macrotermitis TaxID=1346286 RepID=A0A1M5I257_9BACT|nr:cupin domain-containing protein [Dysgonomonas macrotermitis]SHG22396.1 Mannose-6-phosphate isomerase, cupin superfamily [Dysgonomonas macrotermitis]
MAKKLLKEEVKHYIWGDNCDGWIFVDTNELSIKQEAMPPSTKEKKHYHTTAQQFFYILKGRATFYIESEKIEINKHEGITITPDKEHYIANETTTPIEFIVVSQPSTNSDRINIE